MIHGLVITHGGLGEEMVRVVEMIMGPQAGFASLSNDGKSVADLVSGIESWIGAEGDPEKGVVLFVDDFGGSCANAAQMVKTGGVGIRILTGINLAMLLDFLAWREGLDLDDLSRRLVEKGREAVSIVKHGGDANT